jgi:hypothetical protein
LQPAEVSTQIGAPVTEAPSLPVRTVWRTICNYILWSYERGSIHYDIMVTLILLFIFVTPYYVNFKDKPTERTPHPTGVVILPDGQNGFIYQIQGGAISGKSDLEVRAQLLRIIEPIAGEVSITKYEKSRDATGRMTYRVWVMR